MKAIAIQPSRLMRRSLGVSLIEALVALAVMAFGMLGIVAIQSSLRFNADVAKQRAEAVRMAQETMERFRSYTALAPMAGKVSWDEVNSSAASAVAGYATNASYTRTVTVDDVPGQRFKTVTVTVGWADRSGNPQTVSLKSVIHRSPPALAGALAISGAGTMIQSPNRRHPSIPLAATDQGNGTSTFAPPGAAPGVLWIFSNETGLILKNVCPPAPASCVDKIPLYGVVRFATDATPPSPEQAESPPSPVMTGIQVNVDQIAPYGPQTVACFHQASTTAITYYCAIPVNPLSLPVAWSGRIKLDGLTLAASVTDASSSAYRVCRYTPVRDCQPVVPNLTTGELGSWLYGAPGSTLSCTDPDPTATPPTRKRRMSNRDQPLNYVLVGEPLVGQNFLVIQAGAAGSPFACPTDDTSTPDIQGNTWHHQPSS